ncbi:MAG: response regulator [Burkholderiaceae bacterium]|nr:response regulator [Burkholderiaceae bacterium]
MTDSLLPAATHKPPVPALPAGLAAPLAWAGALTALLLAGQALPASRFFSSPAHYLPLHTLLEVLAIAVALMVFALGWNLRRQDGAPHPQLLGTAFLAVGLIDLAHMLSYAGMPELVTPSGPEKAINFWLAARAVAAAALLVVALRPSWRAPSWLLLAGALGLSAVVVWVGLWHAQALPRTFVAGQGLTPLKIASEYLLAAAYGGAGLLLLVRACRSGGPGAEPDTDLAWLAAAAWVQGLAEMFFTLYTDVTDTFNLLGHVYKAVAYLMVYRALFVAGVRRPYAALALKGQRLQTLQQALSDSELHYRTLADSGTALIWTSDDQGRVDYANAPWLGFTGRTLDQERGQGWREGVHGQDLPALRAALAQATAQRGPATLHFRLRRADGAWRWLRCDVSPRQDSHGRHLGHIGVALDITEHRELLAELEGWRDSLESQVVERTRELAAALQAAQAASVAKSAFLANISHEIRTPLNAILGMAHLMRREGANPRQALQLARIDAAGTHLLQMLSAVLDLSKIESGRFAVESVPLDPQALVDEVLAMLGERAQAKGLQLWREPGPVPRRLLGDATRLRQALVNYVGNAIKFTASGEVRVRLWAEPLDTAGQAVRLHFEVHDSGPGLDPATLARLFTPFEQGDASISRQFGGTGLGLALTRGLARAMGGDAGVRSQPGQGSCFWFSARLLRDDSGVEALPPPADRPSAPPAGLPAPSWPPPPPPVAAETPAELALRQRHHGRHVLLAEDEPINREVTGALLEQVGLRISFADDGEAALELALRDRPDLVLMDMQMPGVDGLEATRRLRAEPALAGVPVVAFTANAFADDRQRCLDAGMDDFVVKPVDPPLLFAAVLRWLERQV